MHGLSLWAATYKADQGPFTDFKAVKVRFQTSDGHHLQATVSCTWQSSMAYLNRTISKTVMGSGQIPFVVASGLHSEDGATMHAGPHDKASHIGQTTRLVQASEM